MNKNLPKQQPRIAFAMLAAVQATLIFTITMISVPLPDIAREFGISSAELLLLSAAYGLPFSGLLLFGGRLADRYSGRRMFLFGVVIYSLASVVSAMAPNFEILVAMRVIQGVGGAVIAPAAMAVIHALYPDPDDHSRAISSWGGISVIGSVLGFLLSGIITTWVSWRWMFLVPVVVSVFALLSANRLLPKQIINAEQLKLGLDPSGAILATLGISLGSYGLIASGDYAWSSHFVFVPLILGCLLIISFFSVERKVKNPLLPPGFVLEPCRIVGLSGMFLAAATAGGLISFILSLYLQQVRSWTPFETSAAFAPFAVTLIIVGRLAVPLVHRYGASRITISGLSISAVGLGLLANLAADTPYLIGLLPGLLFLSAGGALLFSGSAVLSTSGVPQHQAGLAGGVMNTAMELGPTIGLAVLMSIAALQVDVVDGYAWAFGSASVLLFATAFAAMLLLSRNKAV